MSTHPNDLVITRLLKAPRATVWKAWSDPKHLKHWWAPAPWTTEVKAFDLRPGGAFHTLLSGPDGGVSDNPGAFLEVVPGERIVWTTALVGDWRPHPEAWMPISAIMTFEDEGEHTRYTAVVRHPDQATRDKHEEMGFHEGWGTCMEQLGEYAARVK